jgi:hypothetical protein
LAEAANVVEPDFAEVLRRVNGLRNKYAHRLSFEPKADEVIALQKSLQDMKRPFVVDTLPPTEVRVTLAFASISGWLERRAREIGATDIDGD